MNGKKLFSKHVSRLKLEGVLHSLLWALAVGFAVLFIVTAVLLLIPLYEKVDIALWAAIASFVATVPVVYFVFYRPNVLDVARRLDKTGLEERIITMMELQDDQSEMARVQRNDATVALEKVQDKKLKLNFPTKAVLALAICVCVGAGTTAYYSMVSNGTLGGIIPPEPLEEVTVIYDVEEGGEIVDDPIQTIYKGESTVMVEAVPMDGWAFQYWDDGNQNPLRYEVNVQEDAVYVAVFAPVGSGAGNSEGDSEGGDERPGEQPDADGGDKEPNENPSNASGKYNPVNQVIDGQTYYGDVFMAYYEQAMKELAENTTMSEEMREVIKSYFDILYRENTGEDEVPNP